MRSSNQDPIENFFCLIRQHGIANTNPTCHQFTAALKTVVLNNLAFPVSKTANCENDRCENLENFRTFLKITSNQLDRETSSYPYSEMTAFNNLLPENSAALTYVAGYLLKRINIPDKDCPNCLNNVYAKNISEHHLYTSFKEYSNVNTLLYESDQVIKLTEQLHNNLYSFLDKNDKLNLEDEFKKMFCDKYNTNEFCDLHCCDLLFIDHAVTFLIFKYVKDFLIFIFIVSSLFFHYLFLLISFLCSVFCC